jgi:pumilio RNA-binding family
MQQVIQRLFQHGTQTQKTALVKSMEGHVVYLSCNLYGCRVIQMVCIRFYYEPAKRFFLSLRAWKAIQLILPEQQASFVRELEPHIISCIKDSNGSHVLCQFILVN